MNSDFMVNFGNIIKRSRLKLGITQAELGQKVDRPQSSIARLESGQLGDTHFGFILDLAKALDMPAENLVAAAFGRETQFAGKKTLDKSQILESIKQQLQEADPLTRKLIADFIFGAFGLDQGSAKGARVKKMNIGTSGTCSIRKNEPVDTNPPI